jgi:uncharacterized protein DUF4375
MTPTQYVISLSESPVTDFGRKEFSEQSEPQKVFTAVFSSSGAIMMDGLAGYFTNSDGESASFVAKAYQIIGSQKRADILKRACAVVSNGPIPEGTEERHVLMSSLSNAQTDDLELLSDEFMMLSEEIDPLLLAYLRTNPEVFGSVPTTVE